MQQLRIARLRSAVLIMTIGFAPSLTLTGCDSGSDGTPVGAGKGRPRSGQVVHGIHAESPCRIARRAQDTIETGAQGPLTPRFSRVASRNWLRTGIAVIHPRTRGIRGFVRLFRQAFDPLTSFLPLSLHRGDL